MKLDGWMDPLLFRTSILWFLMQALERSCNVYIRHLLEVPPLLPTTDYIGVQVWCIIGCNF